MRYPGTEGRWGTALRALALALLTLAVALLARHVLVPLRFVGDGLRTGSFEQRDGVITLVIDARRVMVFPTVLAPGPETLQELPGGVLALPLPPGRRYRLRAPDGGVPHVAVAEIAPDDRPDPVEAEERGERVVRALIPALAAGATSPEWAPWDAGTPWRADARRLAAVDATCREGADGATIAVQVDADGPHVTIGRCPLPVPPAAEPGHRLALLALAGPSWLQIDSPGHAWGRARLAGNDVLRALAEGAATLVLFLAAGFGSAGVWSVGLAALAVLPWLPAASLALVLLGGLGGALAVGVRGARWLWRSRGRRWVQVCAGLSLAAIGAGALAWHAAPETALARCVVAGYSTAGGASLSDASPNLTSLLTDGCDACGASVARRTYPGGNLALATSRVCSAGFPLQPGGTLVFLGGTNDELMPGDALSAVTTNLAFLVFGEPSLERTRALFTPDEVRCAQARASELATLRTLTACVRARGARLVYLHDFLAADLGSGRTAPRQALLEARRAEVEAEGGTFVDLLQATSDEVGVAWMNDFIHLSEIGHRRVAELACRGLERAESARSRPPSGRTPPSP